MPIVAMINRKGGVGKTTITLALADFLSANHSRNVLVIDVDPQANASLALLGQDEWFARERASETIADLFNSEIADSRSIRPESLIRPVARSKNGLGAVSVVPSSPRLQEVEEGALEGLSSWSYMAGSPYLILHRAFSFARTLFDYVLIDCPPSLGIVSMNALSLASGYLMPMIPDYISMVGLGQMAQRMDEHAKGLRRKIPRYGTIVNKFKRGATLHNTLLADLRGRPEAQPVWNTVIPDTVRAEELDAGVISLKARYGGGTSSLYQAFEALAAEFLQRIS